MVPCFIYCTFNLADGLGIAKNFLAKEHLNVKEKLSFIFWVSIMNLAQIGLVAVILL